MNKKSKKENQTHGEKQSLSCSQTQMRTQTQSISECLQALITCTQKAIEAASNEKTEELLLVMKQRQMLVDKLKFYGDPLLKTLSAQDLAQRARLYELDAKMTAKAEALREKQRHGLMSVKRERLVNGYGKQQPKTIQALDRRG